MDRKRYKKRRNILYLIESYLIDMGYKTAANCVRHEAKLTDEFTICDNINLETIVIEFEIFYFQRFKIYPQLCKREMMSWKENVNRGVSKLNRETGTFKKSSTDENSSTVDFTLYNSNKPNSTDICYAMTAPQTDDQWAHNDDWKEYVNIITRNMVSHTWNTRWEEIKGLDHVKNLLKEAVIYPLKYPHLFNGVIDSWKSILLYGPPGTGKTLLAKTAATESSAMFFDISPSLIVSKWRGDSEKLIKVLFEMARRQAPSIIFIDEIDSFALKRSIYEHEASRRMKAEIFTAFDTILGTKNKVFILATTNTPWDLDEAILRRFEKHVHIGLPVLEARKQLLEHFLFSIPNKINYETTAKLTENFTGNDLKNFCKEIKMRSLRQIVADLELQGTQKNYHECKITDDDVHDTLAFFKPSPSVSANKYTRWETEAI